MPKINNLIKKLNNKQVILLDGGTGTELQRRGVHTGLPLWSTQALLKSPQIVKEVHRDYALAGSEIIRTNTFRSNKRTLDKANIGDRDFELTKLAGDLVREGIAEADVDCEIYIGGSQAPLEDCYCPDLVPDKKDLILEHDRWSQTLAEAGVDFIFLETFNKILEAKIAFEAANKTGLPVAISFVCTKDAKLLSGESLEDAVKTVEPLKPFAILINCMSPDSITTVMPKLHQVTSLPVGGFGNGIGHADDDQGWLFEGGSPVESYCKHVQAWLEAGAKLVGGCCGTNPEYIKAITQLASTER